MNEIAKPEKESDLQGRVYSLSAAAGALEVADKDSHAAALEFIDRCYGLEKQVRSFMDEDIANAHKTWKGLTSKRKALLDASESARRVVGQKVVKYEDIARKQAAAAQAEAIENQRRKDEEFQLERAIVHEEMGMPGLAAEILDEKPDLMPAEAPMAIATRKGVGTAVRWKGRLAGSTPGEQEEAMGKLIRHIADNPEHRELVKLDDAAVNRLAAALKRGFNIPGLVAYEDKKVQRSR